MTTNEDPDPTGSTSVPAGATTATGGRARGIVTVLLVILTCLSIVLTSVAYWAHTTLLDTDKFMAAVGPALEDEDLYTALGNRVTAEVLSALDLETRVASALGQLDDFLFTGLVEALNLGDRGQEILNSFDRPSLQDLASTVSSGVEDRITTRINEFVQSADFQDRVPQLVRAAHQRIVALLRDDLAEIPNVSVENGEVRLNLIPIIEEAIRRVLPDLSGLGPDITLPATLSDKVDEARKQLTETLGAQLPDDFGQLTIMSEDRLTELQDALVMLDRAVWALVILSFILIAVTLWVSRTRRRTAIQLAIGVVIGVPVTQSLVRWIESQILEAVTNPAGDRLATRILYQVTAGLRGIELWIALTAVILGFIVYVSGRPPWVMRIKEWWDREPEPGTDGSSFGRWVARHYGLVRVLGIVIAVAALYIPDLSFIWVIVIGVALGLYLWLASEINRRANVVAEETVSV